ncbi:hypothetical protein D918_00331 [Trichuris suis]|nr:hypothetical protein D918_00331 [Trichuris suis]
MSTSDFDTLQLWEKVRYSFSRLVNREMYNGPLVNASDVHVYLGAHDFKMTLDSYLADGKPAARLQQVDAFIYEGRVNCSFFYKDRMICARGRTNSCGPEELLCIQPMALCKPQRRGAAEYLQLNPSWFWTLRRGVTLLYVILTVPLKKGL